jgi:hypothetical protein
MIRCPRICGSPRQGTLILREKLRLPVKKPPSGAFSGRKRAFLPRGSTYARRKRVFPGRESAFEQIPLENGKMRSSPPAAPTSFPLTPAFAVSLCAPVMFSQARYLRRIRFTALALGRMRLPGSVTIAGPTPRFPFPERVYLDKSLRTVIQLPPWSLALPGSCRQTPDTPYQGERQP